jgi:hypothetical protein
LRLHKDWLSGLCPVIDAILFVGIFSSSNSDKANAATHAAFNRMCREYPDWNRRTGLKYKLTPKKTNAQTYFFACTAWAATAIPAVQTTNPSKSCRFIVGVRAVASTRARIAVHFKSIVPITSP